MTLPIPLRRRPTPRRRIVSVSNTWRVTPAGEPNQRRVTVRDVDGQLVTRYLSDDHPALVRYLARAHAAAVAA